MSTGGAQMAEHRDSGGDGPPIVFCGEPSDEGAVTALGRAIGDPWRVVTWVDAEEGRRSAGALLSLLDALGIERAVLVGAGRGAAVAVHAALAAPDRTRALALIGTLPATGLPADLDDRLIELDMPVLLVPGTDAVVAVGRADHLAAGLPDCRGVAAIPGTADRPHATRPDAVAATLLAFLPDLPA